jgi:thermitase
LRECGRTTITVFAIALLLVTALSAIPPRSYAISAAESEFIPGEFIVGFKREFLTPEAGKQLAVSKSGKILKELTHPALNAILVRVPLQQADVFQRAMKESPLVRYVEPNLIVSTTIVPNDPRYRDQWAPPKIRAPQAWDINTGSSSVRVGVLDTGVDYTHEDIASNYLACGYDWVNSDTDPMDDHSDPVTGNSHGTHVAGIAARTNNGIGVAGIAGGWGTSHGVTLIAEKVMNSTGSGDTSTLALAITHAVDVCGVDIINMSLGWYDFFSYIVQSALQFAADRDVISVAAAGNENRDNSSFYPCAYGSGHPLSTAEIVMCVSATDSSDNRASFSDYGNPVDISAPGVNVLSTVRRGFGDYGYKSGTSIATPHVVGVVALVMSQFPGYTRDQVWMDVLTGTDDFGPASWDAYYGWGRLNAHLPLVMPRILLSPNSAPRGTVVSVAGFGFSTSDTSCAISSSPSGLMSNPQCEVSTGVVSGSFTVASDARVGSYIVTATGTTGDKATGSFAVTVLYSRVSGSVAADTAGKLALMAYPSGASTIYLANLGGLTYDEEFHVVDALTAGSSVGNTGPLLLVPGTLDAPWKQTELDTTIGYLNQLHSSSVVFLGSTGSISQQVEDYVRSRYASATYDRVSGTVAADTAGLLALRAYPSGSSTVYIGHLGGFTATDEFHIVDALTAGSSVGNSAPVLLVPGNLDADWKKIELDTTISYLSLLGASYVVILGSIGSITQEVEDYLKANYPSATYSRISGTIAADTAGMLALIAYPSGASTVYLTHLGGLTSAEEFHVVDALTAGGSVGNSAPVLLVPGNLDAPWKQTELDRTIYYLNQLHPWQVIFLGSTGSISQQVEDYVRGHYAVSSLVSSGSLASESSYPSQFKSQPKNVSPVTFAASTTQAGSATTHPFFSTTKSIRQLG